MVQKHGAPGVKITVTSMIDKKKVIMENVGNGIKQITTTTSTINQKIIER